MPEKLIFWHYNVSLEKIKILQLKIPSLISANVYLANLHFYFSNDDSTHSLFIEDETSFQKLIHQSIRVNEGERRYSLARISEILRRLKENFFDTNMLLVGVFN
jgi:hypothetical protein